VGVRVLTLNLWGMSGDWPRRRAVLQAGVRALAPDVVSFQEVWRAGGVDTAAEVLGPDYHVLHQTVGLVPDASSAAVASRWPLTMVDELEQRVTPRTEGFPAISLIAELEAPEPVGRLLLVNHGPSWQADFEHERELQTVAAARRIEELAGGRYLHVVLAGDLNAAPDTASIRFLRGLQSLGGMSVAYLDAWEQTHPGEPGHTFTPRNPLVMEETQMRSDQPRRIDYILIRHDERGPTLTVTACELALAEPVAGVWASDHFGVVADLVPAT
jgi:endonuclease/exonuclease/phosphatase family metal-dependent hydrolase